MRLYGVDGGCGGSKCRGGGGATLNAWGGGGQFVLDGSSRDLAGRDAASDCTFAGEQVAQAALPTRLETCYRSSVVKKAVSSPGLGQAGLARYFARGGR